MSELAPVPSENVVDIEPDDIVVEFNGVPYLVLNFENHVYTFSIDTTITNYFPSSVTVLAAECKTFISASGFIHFEKSKPLSLKPRARGQYRFEKSLTDGEVKRALQLFGEAYERRVQVEFSFLLATPLGDREIHPPAKQACIVMSKSGQPESTKEAMLTPTKHDFKIAILKELEQAGKEVYKLNLLGNHPGSRGPLEHRLGVTFDKTQRAQAAQAFDELKQEGLTLAPYSPAQTDPENWVEITDAGREALHTGILDIGIRVGDSLSGSGLSKFGIPNHSSFLERMNVVNHEVTSLLFLDLDNFKSVNDNYNHSVGDQVIREAMAVIQEATKGKGELFHRDGDEMLVLLLNFDDDEATSVAGRIRRSIEEYSFSTIGQGLITVTIGISSYPRTCARLSELEVTADTAAMEAKRFGKNTVLSAPALGQAAIPQTSGKLQASASARAFLSALSEELATNLQSVTNATYGQLGRLLDDRYRQVTGERFYIDLPGELRNQLGDAYRSVREVNGYIENSMHQETYTPSGTAAWNSVVKAKHEACQPLRIADDNLKEYLTRTATKSDRSS